jgi:hypothetical protein
VNILNISTEQEGALPIGHGATMAPADAGAMAVRGLKLSHDRNCCACSARSMTRVW